ncbi:MAG: hypothetical protein CBCREVIR_2218 [Candidatus Burkholderia crenata]|nr:MAG: hypothetical protein CBCREVIR_2218 [Candidatus Burkholderia crenata]
MSYSLDHSPSTASLDNRAGDKPAGWANYNVAASSRRAPGGTMPTLRITRLSDKRVIYPFVGCADMPLSPDAQSLRDYAEQYGASLVDGDIAVPE